MSYRIAILPYFIDGQPVSTNPDDGPFDDVIAEGADLAVVEAVADRWARSPIGHTLRIYTPAMDDLRLLFLQQRLEDEYGFQEEHYRVTVSTDRR